MLVIQRVGRQAGEVVEMKYTDAQGCIERKSAAELNEQQKLECLTALGDGREYPRFPAIVGAAEHARPVEREVVRQKGKQHGGRFRRRT